VNHSFAHTGLFLWALPLLVVFSGGCSRESLPEPEPVPFVRLLEHQTLNSRILNRTIHYAVLLPETYPDKETRFPVVYLLHGFGESETGWYKSGNFRYYSDQFASETVPMIYVMPEGFNTYWVNKYNGNYPYMDMFTRELVPAIDSLFRTVPDAIHRAVMGYSMGGYGAMILPVKRPDLFKTGVVLSMSFRTDEQYLTEPQGVFDYQWGTVFGGIGATGNQRLTDYFKAYSPFHFLGQPGGPPMDGINLLIDCGDDEETLSFTNNAFHDTLRSAGIPHLYRVRSGGHSWDYWHHSLPEALKFIGYAVRQMPYPSDPAPPEYGSPVPADRVFEGQLPKTGLNYTVSVPSSYAGSTSQYPLILVIHDRTKELESSDSQKLLAFCNTLMNTYKLPESIVAEIPLQGTVIDSAAMEELLLIVRSEYRTFNDRAHTLILGNDRGGRIAVELMHGFSSTVGSCFLFDAALDTGAQPASPDLFYYLDIADQGVNYHAYHHFYRQLRETSTPYEYRVRQGTPSHDTFLNGIGSAALYIKDHLKNTRL